MLVSKDVLLSTFYSRQALWSRLWGPFLKAPLIVATTHAFPYCFQMLGRQYLLATSFCELSGACRPFFILTPLCSLLAWSLLVVLRILCWLISSPNLPSSRQMEVFRLQWIFSGSLLCLVQCPLKRPGVCRLLVAVSVVWSHTGSTSVYNHFFLGGESFCLAHTFPILVLFLPFRWWHIEGPSTRLDSPS